MEESASMDIRPAAASTIYNDELVSEISGMFQRMESRSSKCCIYRVPHHLRKWNEEAYTPQVISIGPFHHENVRLKAMEELKESFFRNFLCRWMLRLECLVHTIREMEVRIRGCYDESFDLSSDRFVKMILVDASFILELIFSRNSGNPSIEGTRAVAIMLDLVLLENQLPFFVLEELYNLAVPPDSWGPGLLNLCVGCFGVFNNRNIWPHPNVKIEHLTDLLRIWRIPPPEKRPERGPGSRCTHTATQLHEAGVKFKVISSDSFFDIKFRNGVLEIPFLKLSDEMEGIYRNIVALEQARYAEGYFVEYITFMALLITTRKDVDLLCDKKILFNCLGDSYAAALMIKNLSKGILFIGMRHDYYVVGEELRRFFDQRLWHRRMALLKREYFSNVFQAITTIVSLGVITVLTLIQTVCSIMQVKGSS